MPTSYSWTLLTPPTPAPSTVVTVPGAPTLSCPFQPYTQQELLDLFDRLLPLHYLAPLKSPGPGYEVLQAAAAMGARVSTSVARMACGAYILSSTGGAKATGTVELFRASLPTDTTDPTIVKAGTVVKSSKGGRRYKTLADVTFTVADYGPFTVAVEALQQGYDFNEPGLMLTADGTVLPGEIDTIDTLVEDPPLGDVTIQVRQLAATTGGADACLDAHGNDRNIPRGSGEADDVYRGRIRALPDNISPDAVDRAMQQMLHPYGQSYQFIETWDIGYQTCWDAPSEPIPGSEFDPNLFVFDDPRSATPFRGRWMDESEYRGAFIVVVPNYGPVTDFGMAYDDTAADATALSGTYGSRSVGAWDVPSSLAFGFRQGAWDGYDTTRAATMKAAYDTLQGIKAAGVAAVLELAGN